MTRKDAPTAGNGQGECKVPPQGPRLWFKVEAPIPGVPGSGGPDHQEIGFDMTKEKPLVLRTELSIPQEAARLLLLRALANGLVTDLTPERSAIAWGNCQLRVVR